MYPLATALRPIDLECETLLFLTPEKYMSVALSINNKKTNLMQYLELSHTREVYNLRAFTPAPEYIVRLVL
jgi:hypothetical protein